MSLPLFTCRPIGIIHTPHTDPAQTPRQPIHAADYTGRVEIFPEFMAGLAVSYTHLTLPTRSDV